MSAGVDRPMFKYRPQCVFGEEAVNIRRGLVFEVTWVI
jgi:hypothetical protein